MSSLLNLKNKLQNQTQQSAPSSENKKPYEKKPSQINTVGVKVFNNFDFKPIQGSIKEGINTPFLRAFDDSTCSSNQQILKEELFSSLYFATLSAHVAQSVAFRSPDGSPLGEFHGSVDPGNISGTYFLTDALTMQPGYSDIYSLAKHSGEIATDRLEVLSGAFGQKVHSSYTPVLTVMESSGEYSGNWMFLHGVGVIIPSDETLKDFRSNKNKAALVDNIDQSKLACMGPLCARLIYLGNGEFTPIPTGNIFADSIAKNITENGIAVLQEYSKSCQFAPQLVSRQECIFTVPYQKNHLIIQIAWLEQVVASCSPELLLENLPMVDNALTCVQAFMLPEQYRDWILHFSIIVTKAAEKCPMDGKHAAVPPVNHKDYLVGGKVYQSVAEETQADTATIQQIMDVKFKEDQVAYYLYRKSLSKEIESKLLPLTSLIASKFSDAKLAVKKGKHAKKLKNLRQAQKKAAVAKNVSLGSNLLKTPALMLQMIEDESESAIFYGGEGQLLLYDADTSCALTDGPRQNSLVMNRPILHMGQVVESAKILPVLKATNIQPGELPETLAMSWLNKICNLPTVAMLRTARRSQSGQNPATKDAAFAVAEEDLTIALEHLAQSKVEPYDGSDGNMDNYNSTIRTTLRCLAYSAASTIAAGSRNNDLSLAQWLSSTGGMPVPIKGHYANKQMELIHMLVSLIPYIGLANELDLQTRCQRFMLRIMHSVLAESNKLLAKPPAHVPKATFDLEAIVAQIEKAAKENVPTSEWNKLTKVYNNNNKRRRIKNWFAKNRGIDTGSMDKYLYMLTEALKAKSSSDMKSEEKSEEKTSSQVAYPSSVVEAPKIPKVLSRKLDALAALFTLKPSVDPIAELGNAAKAFSMSPKIFLDLCGYAFKADPSNQQGRWIIVEKLKKVFDGFDTVINQPDPDTSHMSRVEFVESCITRVLYFVVKA